MTSPESRTHANLRFSSAPTLGTKRLTLRALTIFDWENYATAWADPETTRFIGGEPRSREVSWPKFCQAVGLWPLLGYGYWGFFDVENGAFLGNGGLAQFERGIPELAGFPEAGWAFTAPNWGKGLATEAVGAILNWADSHLPDPEIRCIIAPENAASVRVAEKCGFTKMHEVENSLGVSILFGRLKSSCSMLAPPSC